MDWEIGILEINSQKVQKVILLCTGEWGSNGIGDYKPDAHKLQVKDAKFTKLIVSINNQHQLIESIQSLFTYVFNHPLIRCNLHFYSAQWAIASELFTISSFCYCTTLFQKFFKSTCYILSTCTTDKSISKICSFRHSRKM